MDKVLCYEILIRKAFNSHRHTDPYKMGDADIFRALERSIGRVESPVYSTDEKEGDLFKKYQVVRFGIALALKKVAEDPKTGDHRAELNDLFSEVLVAENIEEMNTIVRRGLDIFQEMGLEVGN